MLHLLPDHVQRAYSRYTNGDRGDEARAAKRLYMRAYRDAARMRREIFELQNPGARYVVDGITHGSNGYTNQGCRCRTCVLSWKLRRVEQDRERAA